MSLKQVCVLGCGALGTVLANLVANNVSKFPEYKPTVMWYVRSEEFSKQRLVDVIKNNKENPKYAPGISISDKVIVCDDASSVTAAADVILFAYATRHVNEILEVMKQHMKKSVLFVSFSKGLVVPEPNSQAQQKDICLVSEEIQRVTGIEPVVVSGAMTAKGLDKAELCEATIGSRSKEAADEVKRLLETEYLSLTWTTDVITVELCGALKNILSVAAGIVDGLNLGANTKSAIIRLGLYEIDQYCHSMYAKYDTRQSTLLESCGISELFKCILCQSDAMPQLGDDWDVFNLLIGRMMSEPQYAGMTLEQIQQSFNPDYVASGPDTAKKIHAQLNSLHLCEMYPLFTAVHLICSRIVPATMLIPMLRHHPAHR
uniref:Glycerol-3-phosphate dehydrogenase [NAD(+)] n=2 Tax=Mesocestoides corti TaxID=53468 RepID=A0A5K3F1Z1_MESCO